jgi:hypothetical protein
LLVVSSTRVTAATLTAWLLTMASSTSTPRIRFRRSRCAA